MRKWRKIHIYVGLLTISMVTVVLYGNLSYVEPFKPREYFVDLIDGARIPPNGTALILLWTTFFRNVNIWPYHSNYDENKCPWKCGITTDKSKLDKSHMVLFNARDLHREGKNYLPKSRDPNQIWLLHNTEPPWWTWLELDQYPGVFNWTSFNREDSDVHNYLKKVKPMSKLKHGVKDVDKYFRKKNKLAVWIVSNCRSRSHREVYVETLKRHIPIEMYGRCANRKQTNTQHTVSTLLEPFKFYLAFENGVCRDYITEKFWRSLELGLIPVVMGDSAAYRKFAPSGSYINTADFPSPEALAHYLMAVASNETLYRSYFDWRRRYTIVDEYWCELCQAVHENRQKQVYRDLYGWFLQDTCGPWNWPDKIAASVENVFRFLTGRMHLDGTFSFS